MRALTGYPVLLGSILFLTSASASAPSAGDHQAAPRMSDIVQQIDQDLRNLTASLARLDKELKEANRRQTPTDPTLRALFDLHRAGWEFHRKQWTVQREHLQFARESLQRGKTHPDDRPKLLEQWRRHEQAFEGAMENFRRDREDLEQQYLKREGELIERELR